MVKYSTEQSKDEILGSLWKYLWKEFIGIIKNENKNRVQNICNILIYYNLI